MARTKTAAGGDALEAAQGALGAVEALDAVTDIDAAAQYLVTRVSGSGYLRMVVDAPGGGLIGFEMGGPGDVPADAVAVEGEFAQVVPGVVAREIVADARLREQFAIARVG